MHHLSRVAATTRRSLITIAAAALAAAALAPAALAASGDSNAATPVLYVHGYDGNLGGGTDCSMWNTMTSALKSQGFTGPQVRLQYYYNDVNCDVNLNNYGSQTTYNAGGTVNGGDSENTSVRHVAYQLAWYIYNTYSSKGQNVGIVAHSMGGLVVRWALYRVAAGDPDFPPSLLVSNIADFGSPHNGAQATSICGSPMTVQCTDMTLGSSLLGELNTSGQNPQAVGGTDWTLLGSDYDTVVTDPSATSMTAAHKVQYTSGDLISHLDYYNRTSSTLNAAFKVSDNGGAYVSSSAGEWPVLRAKKALSSSSY